MFRDLEVEKSAVFFLFFSAVFVDVTERGEKLSDNEIRTTTVWSRLAPREDHLQTSMGRKPGEWCIRE